MFGRTRKNSKQIHYFRFVLERYYNVIVVVGSVTVAELLMGSVILPRTDSPKAISRLTEFEWFHKKEMENMIFFEFSIYSQTLKSIIE